MKKLTFIALAATSFLFIDCSSGKKSLSKTNINPSRSTAGSVTSYDEPAYKTDRRLAAASTDTTNNTGCLGPGTGASYASYSYRNRAHKQANAKAADRNSSLATYQTK